MTRDVLVKFDVHKAIFFQGVHLARLCLAWFQKPQWLGDRHLVDEDLPFGQWGLGNTVTRLDHRGLCRFLGCLYARRCLEKFADRDRVCGIVGPLVNDFEPVIRG